MPGVGLCPKDKKENIMDLWPSLVSGPKSKFKMDWSTPYENMLDILFIRLYLNYMFHFNAFHKILINLSPISTFSCDFWYCKKAHKYLHNSRIRTQIDIFHPFRARSYVNWLNGENKFNVFGFVTKIPQIPHLKRVKGAKWTEIYSIFCPKSFFKWSH